MKLGRRGGGADLSLIQVNEFKTNDVRRCVYRFALWHRF